MMIYHKQTIIILNKCQYNFFKKLLNDHDHVFMKTSEVKFCSYQQLIDHYDTLIIQKNHEYSDSRTFGKKENYSDQTNKIYR